MRRIGAHRILKILFASFTAISLILTSIMAINYSNVMDARIRMPRNIFIQDVQIPEITDERESVKISIIFGIMNPTNIDIFVYDITLQLYMNNLSDPLDIQSSASWDQWSVGLGGFTLPIDSGIRVPSRGSRSIYVNMTVIGGVGGSMAMDNLNVTDNQGKYHPLVIADLRYTFEHIEVTEVVHGIFFYSELGIEPTLPGG